MNAEEDVNFTEAELSSLTLDSNHSSLTGELFSAGPYRSLTPVLQKSLHSSNYSSKEPSLAGDMDEKDDSIEFEDRILKSVGNTSTVSSGVHTPVELTAPSTPDKENITTSEKENTSSTLFGGETTSEDNFLSNNASVESSRQLFANGPGNDDFLSPSKEVYKDFPSLEKQETSKSIPLVNNELKTLNPETPQVDNNFFDPQQSANQQPSAYQEYGMQANTVNQNNTTAEYGMQASTTAYNTTQMTSSQGPNMSQLQYPYANQEESQTNQSSLYTTPMYSPNNTPSNTVPMYSPNNTASPYANNALSSSNQPQVYNENNTVSQYVNQQSGPATLNTTNNLMEKAKTSSPYQATNIFSNNQSSSNEQINNFGAMNINPSNNDSLNNSQSNVSSMNQSNPSGLFIPSMYNNSQDNTAQNTNHYFTPTATSATNSSTNQHLFTPSAKLDSSQNLSTSNYYSNPHQTTNQSTYLSSPQGQQLHYDQHQTTNLTNPNVANANGSYQVRNEQGMWQWLKNTVVNKEWSEGAETIKKQIKNAADSVLTTLDPGMEEFLKPVLNIGVSSQNMSVLLGMKQGFTNDHCTAVVKGQHLLQTTDGPLLPVGFESVMKSVYSSLEYLSKVNFEFPSHHIVVTTQTFITELVAGSWSALACVGLKDINRNLILYSFSQPISLPIEIVTHAYNRTLQNGQTEFTGYDISLEEAVKLHIPYTKDQDWCLMLSGISLQQLISNTARGLSYDYKRNTVGSKNTYQQTVYQPSSTYNQTTMNYANDQAVMNYNNDQTTMNYNNDQTTMNYAQSNNKQEEFSVSFNGF